VSAPETARQSARAALRAAIECHQAGDGERAETKAGDAIEIWPEFSDAHHFRGILAIQRGAADVAEACFRDAARLDPERAPFHHSLGNVLRTRGALDEAAAAYGRALELDPDNRGSLRALVWTHRLAKRYDDAAGLQERLVALEPDSVEAHEALALIRQDQGRSEEAVEGLRAVIARDAGRPAAHLGLGFALEALGRADEAIESYQAGVQLKPDMAHGWHLLGNAYQGLNRLAEAVPCYEKALALDPDLPRSHYNLGVARRGLRDLAGALAGYRRALDLDPAYAEAHNGLAVALKDQGRVEASLEHLERALALKPDYIDAHSNLLFFRHYRAESDPVAVLGAHRAWAARHATGIATRPHDNVPDPERVLRVGYVSPDLRRHSVAFFVEPLLAAHDRTAVEPVCYADVAQPDGVSDRLRELCPAWRDIHGLDDIAAADLVREDRIDILVDLAGHTARHRLRLFAHAPAPVQASWLGYPDTTGLAKVDYRLTDATADPPGDADRWHSEKLIRLANGFLCYRPPADAPAVAPPPSAASGAVTFGSFNTLAKLSPELLDAWALLLARLPEARLVIKTEALDDPAVCKDLLESLAGRGVTAERVALRGFEEQLADHLDRYREIDIALDSTPYTGTTTTCEALWMGVPVVTLAGTRHVGRVGASLLGRLGLDELVADSLEGYVETAAALAGDPARLAKLRDGMRERMRASPLIDEAGFAASIEAAFRDMWRAWCEANS
jgi:protein O-GlcNAc transferase